MMSPSFWREVNGYVFTLLSHVVANVRALTDWLASFIDLYPATFFPSSLFFILNNKLEVEHEKSKDGQHH
jgi:hypothetical protein